MKTRDSPSLNQSYGETRRITQNITDQTITIITNHYLKDIREELLEEDNHIINNINNEIVHVKANLNGTQSIIMIDTGSNVSLIDNIELERIQQNSVIPIPTLPINNIIIVGATGRHNKSVKKQVSLEVTIQLGFLVAHGLPFNILIGCDILRQHAAIIDLRRRAVTLTSEDGTWTAEVIDTQKNNSSKADCQIIKSHYCTTNRTFTIPRYEDDSPELWLDKLEEQVYIKSINRKV